MKRTWLRRESKKHRAEREERRAVVEEVMRRDDYQCRARRLVPEVLCGGPLDAHELVPRSAWRSGYLDPANVVAICRAHHRWIGENVDEAHGRGLHRFSWERPDH